MTSTMHIDLRVGEAVVIGGATVRAVKKDGQRVRLTVQAPSDTQIITPKAQRQNQPCTHECASTPSTGDEQAHVLVT